MITFLGNCQMEFLCRAAAGILPGCEFRALATPEAALRAGGRVPPELAAWSRRFDLEGFLAGRSLRNQFQVFEPGEAAPELVVLNLFHENEPLFAHKDQGWFWFVDPAGWEAEPAFEAWMKERFVQVKLNAMSYPDRWARLALMVRERWPGAPLLLVTRLGHHPGFGPNPRSYLTCWDAVWRRVPEFLQALAQELGNCAVLDADRVLGGVWARRLGTGASPDVGAHIPFLRVAGEPGAERLERDVEHPADLWPDMARHVARYLACGRVEYAPEERVAEAWARPWRAADQPVLDATRLRRLLGSGSNADGGRAVAAWLEGRAEGEPHELLAEAAEAMPVCHHTLLMARRLARLRPGPGWRTWCAAQRRAVDAHAEHGPSYQAKYRARLDDILSTLA